MKVFAIYSCLVVDEMNEMNEKCSVVCMRTILDQYRLLC